ncbi:MAG: outer membrane beta-barrel protein [Desulfuromonadaceae bacterium]|nr:outer membrane beta-barrel protein [Desulfuromonadaceae bacterium]
MRNLTCCILCVLLLAASNVCAGPIRSYVGASAGVVLSDDSSVTDSNGTVADVSYDPGLSLSAVIGHEFGLGFRLEAEVNYKKADTDKFKSPWMTRNLNSDFRSLGMMVNAYYDFQPSMVFTPYVGAGLGFANVNMSSADVNGSRIWNSDSATAFAYQVGFGGNVMINRRMAFDLGYRYFGTNDFDIDRVSSNLGSHNILFGLKYYIH